MAQPACSTPTRRSTSASSGPAGDVVTRPRRVASTVVAAALAVLALARLPRAAAATTTRRRRRRPRRRPPRADHDDRRRPGRAAHRAARPGRRQRRRRPALGGEGREHRRRRGRRPASTQADVVYEEVVEGGITRFLAMFNSTVPDVVGPVRSVRLTGPEHRLAARRRSSPTRAARRPTSTRSTRRRCTHRRREQRRRRDVPRADARDAHRTTSTAGASALFGMRRRAGAAAAAVRVPGDGRAPFAGEPVASSSTSGSTGATTSTYTWDAGSRRLDRGRSTACRS